MVNRHGTAIRGHPRRGTGLVVVMAVSLLSLALVAAPAGAGESESIDATVTVAGPCITLPATPIDFGTVGFSQATLNTVDLADPMLVTNCSGGQNQEVYAQASAAAGSGTGAWSVNQWNQIDLMCDLGVDIFAAGLNSAWLSSAADTLVYASSLSSFNVTPRLVMPCTGSSGVGEVMTFTYSLTAALP